MGRYRHTSNCPSIARRTRAFQNGAESNFHCLRVASITRANALGYTFALNSPRIPQNFHLVSVAKEFFRTFPQDFIRFDSKSSGNLRWITFEASEPEVSANFNYRRGVKFRYSHETEMLTFN